MENVFLTINGKDEQAFLKTYNHNYKSVSEIGLDWQTLVGIHDYYLGIVKNKLEIAAQELFLDLKSIEGVHTIKYRIKDPEHVIDKIIRKKIEKNRIITKENFLDEIDDFIGIRILHLVKTNWESIYKTIVEKFESKETPIAYHRIGDDPQFIKRCKELGLELKEKDAGYRSIHYIAKIPFFSTQFKCEIQIRTIFEEAWSELDHMVRYPNNTDNELLNYYLLMFNRLAGCADEMGSFILNMKANLEKSQNEKEEMLKEIGRLKGKSASQNKKIDELMKKLEKKNALDWLYVPENPTQSTLDYITAIQNPSGSTYINPLADMQERINRLSGLKDINKLYNGSKSIDGMFKMPKIGSYDLYTGEDYTEEGDSSQSKNK